jgi:hypothetical protein
VLSSIAHEENFWLEGKKNVLVCPTAKYRFMAVLFLIPVVTSLPLGLSF